MTRPVVRRFEASIPGDYIGDWIETFRDRVLDGMREVEGFQRVVFLVERDGNPCRGSVPTTWSDMEAVRWHAGDNPTRAVLAKFMARFFPEYDTSATFYDQVLQEA